MVIQAQTPGQIRDSWDRIAPGFDEFATPITMTLADDVLRRVGVGPGTRFLDVAAGSGALSIPAARVGAQVLATDVAPTMIERLNTRARQEGLTNLEGRVMDGHALQLDNDSFDVTASQNGVSLFPDLPRGLREMVRVTRPGGQVVVVAFGSPQRSEFLGFFLAALRAAIPGFTGIPMDPPPLPFQVADPEKLREHLTAAGLRDLRIETAAWQMPFKSGRHLWDVSTSSNPIGAMLVADLSPQQTAEVQHVLDGMLRERSGGRPGAVLTADMNIGVGTK